MRKFGTSHSNSKFVFSYTNDKEFIFSGTSNIAPINFIRLAVKFKAILTLHSFDKCINETCSKESAYLSKMVTLAWRWQLSPLGCYSNLQNAGRHVGNSIRCGPIPINTLTYIQRCFGTGYMAFQAVFASTNPARSQRACRLRKTVKTDI